MSLVIMTDGLKRTDSILKIAESEQTSIVREKSAWTCIFDHGGFASCQVTDGAVTDPRVLKPYIGGFCAAKLSKRVFDVLLIIPGRSRDCISVLDTPTEFL